jgi:hypothetical protein
MRLTVVPSDKMVYVNEVGSGPLEWSGTPVDIHALQWFDTEGWIEYVGDVSNQTITELPGWAMNAYQAWAVKNAPKPPSPTSAEHNKLEAIQFLAATDWSALPDIVDPLKSNPYLANVDEFNTYRNAVRQIAINPVEGDITWPVKPIADWRTV